MPLDVEGRGRIATTPTPPIELPVPRRIPRRGEASLVTYPILPNRRDAGPGRADECQRTVQGRSPERRDRRADPGSQGEPRRPGASLLPLRTPLLLGRARPRPPSG